MSLSYSHRWSFIIRPTIKLPYNYHTLVYLTQTVTIKFHIKIWQLIVTSQHSAAFDLYITGTMTYTGTLVGVNKIFIVSDQGRVDNVMLCLLYYVGHDFALYNSDLFNYCLPRLKQLLLKLFFNGHSL